ncbi:DNA helicase [Bacillus phage Leo2]|uniref:DNA 5'-3' helicase n=1 Tax=Bacillus phage Leo2 TaxID=1815973 RepID=A0A1S5QTP8_9CAUD|nr:DNA helicase [Bacillus phage Leo2]
MTHKTNLKEEIHRHGSERALISIILSDPSQLIMTKSMGLVPDMFAVDGHKFIYMALLYLYDKRAELDPIAITNVFTDENANKAINEIGGIDYLEQLARVDVAPNTKMLVEQIIQASARRDVRAKALEVADKALHDHNTPLDEYLSGVETQFRNIGLEYSVGQSVKKLGEGIKERMKQRARAPKDVIGIKTGWEPFDLAARGLVDGELTIIGARPKVGKSTVLLNWSKKICHDDDIPVLYIDTENYSHEQEDRLLSLISGVDHTEIENGQFAKDTFNGTAKDKMKAVAEASRIIEAGNFYHIYLPFFTPEKIEHIVREYQINHGIKLVCFDYIKLPSSDSKLGDKEWQQLGYLTSKLKDLAGTTQLPIISAVQLNRSGNSDEASSDNIGGSDRILQLANRVCIFRRTTPDEFTATGASHMFKISDQRTGKPLDWTPVKSDGKTWRLEMIG